MVKQEILRGRRDESRFIAENAQTISPTPRRKERNRTQEPLHREQLEIIIEALGGLTDSTRRYLKSVSIDPDLHGATHGQLLIEYTSAVLARQLCEQEILWHRLSKVPFAIPGFGHEVLGVAIERYLSQSDVIYPYYRQEANDLMRGGTVKEHLLLTAQKKDDPHSGGRVLAGHPASAWRNALPVISNVGGNALAAVGVAQAMKLHRLSEVNAPDTISVCHLGEASMAEGEVGEALLESIKDGGSPFVLIVHDNGSGISTDKREGSAAADPIAAARGLERHGLLIIEVDNSNIQSVYDACRRATNYAREKGKPALVHVFNMYKRFHSSSDDPSRYLSAKALAQKKAADPIPMLRRYLLLHGIGSDALFDSIESLAKAKVAKSADEVLASPDPDPEDLYRHLYASAFPYHRVEMSVFHPSATGSLDLLASSRESHVHYLDRLRTDTQVLNMRQHITVVLAEEMKRHDKIVVLGEDVADFSTSTWTEFSDYLDERLAERSSEFSPDEIRALKNAARLVEHGRGHQVDPNIFATLVDLLGGKGGVFKTTQFLQMLYGRQRVWNSRLAEASIVGTSIGLALEGYLPIAEIQFDSYWSPAYQQIVDQMATMRWRSNGQFSAGMVIRIQGMNRLGGVGGIGHGNVILGRLTAIPGIRVVTPATASEAGPLLRESIRLAREHHEAIVFLEPIMELNSNLGHYQGNDTHLPLGESEVIHLGKDFLVLSYGNNIPLVERAQTEWAKQGLSATVINLRTHGVATDWATIARHLDTHGKVLIVESERGTGSAGADLSSRLSEHFFQLLDAPVMRISARDMPTAAGKRNEAFQLPQVDDIVAAGISLARY